MRRLIERSRLEAFMKALGDAAEGETRVYFTGGATAVLEGWRSSTIDVDLTLWPDDGTLLASLPRLKESLEINIELASPAHFIPELPGWQERSRFIGREGRVSFYHYDPYAQALAKIERGHTKDLADVRSMLASGLVQPAELEALFEAIEPELYRYPAIDPRSFRAAVKAVAGERPGASS